ncbi:hypothetical protein F4677DRAFT_409460, partial [Hypoxylon crocopeplum]
MTWWSDSPSLGLLVFRAVAVNGADVRDSNVNLYVQRPLNSCYVAPLMPSSLILVQPKKVRTFVMYFMGPRKVVTWREVV